VDKYHHYFTDEEIEAQREVEVTWIASHGEKLK
jgi:hypothetical protein